MLGAALTASLFSVHPPAPEAEPAVESTTAESANSEELVLDLRPPCEGRNCERPWTGPEPRYWGGQNYGDHTNLRNGGLGLLVAGGGMAVGSVLAATVNMCGRDGAHGTDCSRDTRVHLAIGFGAASALLATAGAVMFGVAQKRRKLDLAFGSDGRGASFSLSGRF